jgi:hypothetical protein
MGGASAVMVFATLEATTLCMNVMGFIDKIFLVPFGTPSRSSERFLSDFFILRASS